ncbi:energy-coupling factor transporter ATPase [Mycoplasma tauri]|uniref:energy-coupling factor transporter ATPase n=1 Tax=Mycoplasma tauri TaxID=547987 RepID=UPI001CBBB403|nr:energy-coupling factor transporter ATPase [Mycoplasma tauri]MBZ4218390.1 energy-coupling factor transporter ATPase [Mycoplasma tauri]
MQINIKNLSHSFLSKTPAEFKAVNSASCVINQGEFIGIIGQTGSGKTTFIEHLNGLILPTEGSIEWIFQNEKFDKETKTNTKFMDKVIVDLNPTKVRNNKVKKPKKVKKIKQAKSIRKRVGVVFQFAEYQLFEETIEKDIAFGPRSFGVGKKEAFERAKKYLLEVGLDETYLKKSPFDLSGGQKRRVALAGILAMEPDFLIADEPTAGLDPVGVVEILNIFKKLHEKGKTIIIVTHDLDNVLEYTQRVLVFKEGSIVRDGETYEVLKDVDFLNKNYMEPPKLLAFTSKLQANNIPMPKVKSIDDLATFLNKFLKEKEVK